MGGDHSGDPGALSLLEVGTGRQALGIAPFGWEGPASHIGWEGITVVIQGRRACWRWALDSKLWASRLLRNGSIVGITDGWWALSVMPVGLR